MTFATFVEGFPFSKATSKSARVTVNFETTSIFPPAQTANGLQLKHDHRHADGTPDEVTMYGGTAVEPGSDLSQSFPADTYTAELIPEAATNVWSITLSADGTQISYYLERHQKPRFRARLYRVN